MMINHLSINSNDGIMRDWNVVQPQVVTICIVFVIIVALAIWANISIRKTKTTKAPNGMAFVAEWCVMSVDSLVKSITGKHLKAIRPYIFTLLCFIMISNLLGLFGLDGPTSAYSVTGTLGFITFIGIYVVGIMHHKWKFFLKFVKNPVEIIGQFAPFISISFRLFGNILSGSMLLLAFYSFTGFVWSKLLHVGPDSILGQLNILGSLTAPPLHFYSDLFDGVVQAFVFAILTTAYWAMETGSDETHKKTKTKKSKNIVMVKRRRLERYDRYKG